MSDNVHAFAQFNMIDVEKEIEKSKQLAAESAERLFESAKEKSRAILAKAIADRDSMFLNCSDEGRKDGYEKGFEEGLLQGRQEFLDSRKADLEKNAEDLKVILDHMSEKILKGQNMLQEAYEKNFLELAFEVASLAVQRDLKENGTSVKEILEMMLKQVLGHHQIVVEVHPSNAASLSSFLPELHERIADLGNITIRSAKMSEHEVRVTTEKGSVMASPEIMLQRLRREWNL